jgi:hypothetical protein
MDGPNTARSKHAKSTQTSLQRLSTTYGTAKRGLVVVAGAGSK